MHDPREVDDHTTLINLDLFKVFDRVDHFLEAALSVTSFQHGFSFLDMSVYATPRAAVEVKSFMLSRSICQSCPLSHMMYV